MGWDDWEPEDFELREYLTNWLGWQYNSAYEWRF